MPTEFDKLPELAPTHDLATTRLLQQITRVINQLKQAVNTLEQKVETLEGYH